MFTSLYIALILIQMVTKGELKSILVTSVKVSFYFERPILNYVTLVHVIINILHKTCLFSTTLFFKDCPLPSNQP